MSTRKRSEDQTWEEAGYSNNFVFRLTMQQENLCRELLECLLDIEITDIKIKQQEKDIETGKESHGIRLDVYIEDSNGVIYDIEMQTGEYDPEYFAKRTRYYQSKLDQELLEKNVSYKKLRRTIIIFICTFDPFGYNLSRYTFKNQCIELPSVKFKDESEKIFFNATGNGIGITKRQKAFLNYVAYGITEDNFTKKLAERVRFVKQDNSERVRYMTWQQEQIEQREIGIEIGKEIGKEEFILKLLKKNKTISDIADMLDFSIDRVTSVAKANGLA